MADETTPFPADHERRIAAEAPTLAGLPVAEAPTQVGLPDAEALTVDDLPAVPSPPGSAVAENPARAEFYEHLGRLAEAARRRGGAPAGAFDRLEENAVFVAFAMSVRRLDVIDRHEIMPSAACARVVQVLGEALPMAPISSEDTALGLAAAASLRPPDYRPKGGFSLGLDMWAIVRILFFAIFCVVFVLMTQGAVQTSTGRTNVIQAPQNPEMIVAAVVLLGLAAWLYSYGAQAQAFYRHLRIGRKLMPVSVRADDAVSALSSGWGTRMWKMASGVGAGLLGAGVVIWAQKVSGRNDTWMTVIFLELGIIVGLAVFPLLIPAPTLKSTDFVRTVAQVDRWREYLTARYAARRATPSNTDA